jgi:hypothetical protein
MAAEVGSCCSGAAAALPMTDGIIFNPNPSRVIVYGKILNSVDAVFTSENQPESQSLLGYIYRY